MKVAHPLDWKNPLPDPLGWKIRIPDLLSWRLSVANPTELLAVRIFTADLPEKLLVFFFIALSPIQDIALQSTPLKGIGACLSLLPFLPLLALCLVRWAADGMWIKRIVLACSLYAAVLTVYGFWRFGFISEGDDLILKSVSNFSIFALYLLPVFLPLYKFRGALRAGCYGAFGILVFGILFSQGAPFGLPGFLEATPLHFVQDSDRFRPRGFSTEPSTLSVSIFAIGMLCAYFSKHRRNKIFFVLATVALLALTGSKGGLLTLLVCASVLLLMRFRRWYQVPVLVMVLVVLSYGAFAFMSRAFPEEGIPEQGIAALGSIQGRVTIIICAAQISLHYPFGVGFSGYTPAIRQQLPETMSFIQGFTSLPLQFVEPVGYLTSSEGLSTKTFLFDGLIRFGWPFVAVFVVLAVNLLKRLADHRILFLVVLASLMAICTYVTLTLQFITPILLGIALAEVRKSQKLTGYHIQP